MHSKGLDSLTRTIEAMIYTLHPPCPPHLPCFLYLSCHKSLSCGCVSRSVDTSKEPGLVLTDSTDIQLLHLEAREVGIQGFGANL
jgi:hypothetical protein